MPKVENAIIMAAGLGTRMRPLTNEIPKPLVKVNGKRMIETIIQGLRKNGITDISIVTGYLADKFEFLTNKYSGLKLINNPYYQQYNNLSSLYVARNELKNTIILDGDQLINNLDVLDSNFDKSGYAGTWVDNWTDEWIMHTDNNGKVVSCDRNGGQDGYRLYSVSKWTAKDSDKLRKLVEKEFNAKNYDIYWDDVAMYKYPDQFDLFVHRVDPNDIVEIDSLDELKAIDPSYKSIGQSDMFSKENLKKIDWVLVIIPIVAVIILSAILIGYPSESHIFLQNCRNFLTHKLMYYYLIVGLVFLLSTLFLGFTKWGKTKLGDKQDRPEYSTLKWGMMIFTSTMSAGIIFYSLCEWMMYANEPLVKQSPDSLNLSLTYSLFHWGPIAWSFYIMLAVAFGYMIYVTKNNKQKFSEACRPLFGKLIDSWLGKIIDLIAIFSLVAATATTFSMSMPLLTAAVKTMTGFGNIKTLSVTLIILVVAIYLIASVIGMKAISRLSMIAVSFLGLLLLFVLFDSGSAGFIVGSSAKALGNLVVKFIPMAATVENAQFTQNWTVYYWAYWMVWCVATPFFIGSISKGRTIRNVIFGGYFWGLLGTYLSFFILSNFGISRQISGVINAVKLINNGDSYADVIIMIIKTLSHYQVGLILLILAMIGLYSTVFDSITMVISKYSYRSLALSEEPSRLMRSFWAILFVLLPLALIITGTSFTSIQSVAIIVAFPTGIVMLLIVISFWCSIVGIKRKKERNDREGNSTIFY